MKFNEWLHNFLKDKKEISVFSNGSTHSFQEIHQLVDTQGIYWEYALTYTGRIVVRSGKLQNDGVTFSWKDWITLHEVEIPTKK